MIALGIGVRWVLSRRGRSLLETPSTAAGRYSDDAAKTNVMSRKFQHGPPARTPITDHQQPSMGDIASVFATPASFLTGTRVQTSALIKSKMPIGEQTITVDEDRVEVGDARRYSPESTACFAGPVSAAVVISGRSSHLRMADYRSAFAPKNRNFKATASA